MHSKYNSILSCDGSFKASLLNSFCNWTVIPSLSSFLFKNWRATYNRREAIDNKVREEGKEARNISQEELTGLGNCFNMAGPGSRTNEEWLQDKAYVAGSFTREWGACRSGLGHRVVGEVSSSGHWLSGMNTWRIVHITWIPSRVTSWCGSFVWGYKYQ